ncbi:spermidine synthase family protein [Flavobacterium silvaticum]|uniref:Uncharacterized protein n=1 Tax=Flavobacterium silvaticum TaxID=1852020 RepID=A0A972FSJ5_9FLAO|nr:hypothetical protein [Flavobacterium silvaticum]NMH26750.1 hypothetical protein [Flavobacterium silvaticum]
MSHQLLFQLQSGNPEDEEFNLFLFAILMTGVIMVCLCFIVALILIALAIVVILGLIGIGALSASVIVGLSQKSLTKGFKTFVIVFSTLTSGVIAAFGFWGINSITHWWSTKMALLTGLGIGLVGGFAIGFIIAYLIRKLSNFIKLKLEKRKRLREKTVE